MKTYEEETALIKELEATRITRDDTVQEWHSNNTLYHQHEQKIKDAYWRRRMLSAKPGECAPG